MKRTEIDFSKHVLTTTINNDVSIYEFKIPNKYRNSLIFINCRGLLTVGGDFGNWVFCREFHPSSESGEGVSDSYWDEKLRIASTQKSHEYDTEETLNDIEEFKKTFVDTHDREMSEDELDWVEQLENSVYDEHEYIYTAYRENPNTIEYEDAPFGKKRHFWLDVVYDAFDEMCRVMQEQEKIKLDQNKIIVKEPIMIKENEDGINK